MSEFYGDTHRAFQDEHGTRRLADRLESLAHAEFDANDRAFIESATMFFLATVDERGRPTVSYKGGAPGFVHITGPGELVFPVFDGNGMYLSLGNIASTANIGMLFIDFESPRACAGNGRNPLQGRIAGPGGRRQVFDSRHCQPAIRQLRAVHSHDSRSHALTPPTR
jgi:uncharacterized protein